PRGRLLGAASARWAGGTRASDWPEEGGREQKEGRFRWGAFYDSVQERITSPARRSLDRNYLRRKKMDRSPRSEIVRRQAQTENTGVTGFPGGRTIRAAAMA